MPAGGPASNSRGRGGKFKKYTRGGGHSFSRNLQPVDADGNRVSMWSADGRSANQDDDDEDDDSEEDSSEEEDSDDDGPSKPPAASAEASREDRRALKKARKEAAIARQKGSNVEVGDMPSSDESEDEDDDMPANPNHSKAARKQAAAATAPAEEDGVDEVTDGVKKMAAPASRRERESMEAAAAKEKYMKLHAAGKTDEAKADLARLKVIREQRATEAARRQAEKEERDALENTRRAEIEAKEAKKREAAAGPKKGKKK